MPSKPQLLRGLRLPLAIISGAILVWTPLSLGRDFEDKFGRTITAELSGHWGTNGANVQIKKGGKLLNVKVADFAAKEEVSIRKWMADNPDELVPLQDPEHIGEGLISGTKWMMVSGKGGTVLLEFGGAGLFKVNGKVAKNRLWEIVNDGDMAFSIPRLGTYLFDNPIATERIYADTKHPILLVKLDRAPRPVGKDQLEGKSFALVNQKNVSAWNGSKKDKRLIADLHKAGKVTIGGEDFIWKLAGGSIALQDRKGNWHNFQAQSQDIWVNGDGSVLWQIPGPDGK